MAMPESIRRLDMLAGGFQQSQILFTAVRGGVFEHLREPAIATEVAQKLGWSLRGTEMLLDGLVAIELIMKQDGRYHNGPEAAACLVEGARYDQRNIIRHKGNCWDAWSKLDECVRTGHGSPHENRNTAELQDFILGMQNIARESAQCLLEAVDLSEFTHVLDLGGGPATFAITFLKQHPNMRATLFDFPEVVAIGKKQVAEQRLEDRFCYVEGNMLEDGIGSGYDLILLSNIIHSFGIEENLRLVQKCHAALQPGGMLMVKDFLVNDDRSGPPFSLIFGLHMLALTESGATYTTDEVAGWADSAGFSEGRRVEITPQSRLWLARK